MYSKALVKAHGRLRVAQRAVDELPKCETYTEFSDAWYVFLHASKGIYTTLEQGAKATAQARQWFGAQDRFRREDELLRYITEARNDDEHGIEDVTEFVPEQNLLGVSAPGYSNIVRDQFGNTVIGAGVAAFKITGTLPPDQMPKLTSLDGKPVMNHRTPPHPRLVPVRDRSKRIYHPPTQHLGRPLENSLPITVARLMIVYLEHLLDEAEGFRKP